MIRGVGTDIIEIERMEKAIQKQSFLKSIFTENEIDYFKQKGNKVETLAAAFCAKESVAKAIGTGFRGFSPIDVELVHNPHYQKPAIVLSPKLQAILHEIGIEQYHFEVSLSHCQTYAVAFVLFLD